MNIIPLTSANFEEHKQKIIQMINDIDFDELDPDFEMSLKNGISMGTTHLIVILVIFFIILWP